MYEKKSLIYIYIYIYIYSITRSGEYKRAFKHTLYSNAIGRKIIIIYITKTKAATSAVAVADARAAVDALARAAKIVQAVAQVARAAATRSLGALGAVRVALAIDAARLGPRGRVAHAAAGPLAQRRTALVER